MNEPLMTIGLFSRASLVSVKALRAYHHRGILVPASVDPATGYRAYHPGQLADATTIRRLRALDVPLDVVKQILDERNPDTTAKLLARHAVEMQQRLADTARILTELQALTESAASSAVHVESTAHLDAIAVSGHVLGDDYAVFLSAAYPLLAVAADRAGLTPCGPSMALYTVEAPDSDEQPVTACIPVGSPAPIAPLDDAELIELPAATVAIAVHDGGYDTVGDAYASLGAWVAHHAVSSGEPVREIYVVSYDQTPDPSDFRTEIHWPIEARPEETP